MNAKQKRAVVYLIGLVIICLSNTVSTLIVGDSADWFTVWFIIAVIGLIISIPASTLLYRKWKAEEALKSLVAKKAIEGKQGV